MMSESSMAAGMLVGMFSRDEIKRAIDIIEEGKAIWLYRIDDDGSDWEYDYGFYDGKADMHGHFYIRDSRKEDDEPPESYVISIGFFEYNRLFGFMPGGDTHEDED